MPCSFFNIEKHSLALSVITRGVTNGASKKALAMSAALVLSPSSHLTDNKGRLSSQVKSSSSDVLTLPCCEEDYAPSIDKRAVTPKF